MTLEEAIHDQLMEDPIVLALLVQDKVYYGQVAQGAQLLAPYVRFEAVTSVTEETFQGESGPIDVRYQFDCYAETAQGARNLAKAVRKALQGYQGKMPESEPVNGVFVQSALCEGGNAGRDGYDDAVNLHVCSVDIIVSTADTDL